MQYYVSFTDITKCTCKKSDIIKCTCKVGA